MMMVMFTGDDDRDVYLTGPQTLRQQNCDDDGGDDDDDDSDDDDDGDKQYRLHSPWLLYHLAPRVIG